MTIGIYGIVNKINNKIYVGKSVHLERRFTEHKYRINNKIKKDSNRYLANAVAKYGWVNFELVILEVFNEIDAVKIAERELYWMDFYKSYNRNKGYNLRRDTSIGMVVHSETRKLLSKINKGSRNPNFGNNWSEDEKKRMSEIKIKQHSEDTYGEEWKGKISKASKKFWSENPDIKQQMANKVKMIKRKYHFKQMTKEGLLIAIWPSVEDIINVNPTWKWQNIYSVCNGYKKTYMGFKWQKFIPNTTI